MSWIKTVPPTPEAPEVERAFRAAMADYPAEYTSPELRAESRLPDAVARESIVRSHSLIPRAMEHFFAGYAALLDPALPLSRREHELIAATVSAANRCFY